MSGVSPLSGESGSIARIMEMRREIIERNSALRQIHESGRADQATADTTPASGFGTTLKSALDSVNATQARAEGLSSAYQTGEVTDVAKVMLARQEAGIAFEATMQVRNKLLNAYQDIMRMGV